MISFGHTGDLGDIIYALPTVRALGGGKLVLYQRPGTREPFTMQRYRLIERLLRAQPYIKEVEYGDGVAPCDYEFWPFRDYYRRGANLAEIQAEYLNVEIDIKTPWLTVPLLPEKLDLVVVNRSPRYRDRRFDYHGLLRVLRKKTLFVGLPLEHQDFEQLYGPVTFYPTRDLYEVAMLIANSRAFVGNQSCCNAIAEGLKVNKMLERHLVNCDCLFPV